MHKDNTDDTKHKNKVKQPTKVYKLDIKVADIPNIVKNHYFPLSENFEITNIIGTGSESWVSKAIHKKTKKELAIKYIKTMKDGRLKYQSQEKY